MVQADGPIKRYYTQPIKIPNTINSNQETYSDNFILHKRFRPNDALKPGVHLVFEIPDIMLKHCCSVDIALFSQQNVLESAVGRRVFYLVRVPEFKEVMKEIQLSNLLIIDVLPSYVLLCSCHRYSLAEFAV